MDDRAVLERAASPGRAFAFHAVIAIAAGCFVVLLASPRAPLARIEHLFDSVRARTSESAEDDWTALVLEVLGEPG